MYIQPEREREEAFTIPCNYSGNAFRQAANEMPSPEPATEHPPADPLPSPAERESITEEAEPTLSVPETPSVPAGACCEEKEKNHGLRDRFPFLTSLLPPRRGEHHKGGILPEWALIGAVILLFLWEDEENDILPFLLLLLLWD